MLILYSMALACRSRSRPQHHKATLTRLLDDLFGQREYFLLKPSHVALAIDGKIIRNSKSTGTHCGDHVSNML